MPKVDVITQARLKELLHYDPETGLFTHRIARGTAKKGSIAGGRHTKGYILIKIDYVMYRAHRLAFLYVLGWMPVEVDHDDHVTDNNRWDNLNPSTRTLNNRNASRRKDNASGTTGVSWNKRLKKWVAQIRVNKKQIHLGCFINKADAIAARQAADIKYGFHENHGVAAC